MSCFWDALRTSLPVTVIDARLGRGSASSAARFAAAFKDTAVRCDPVAVTIDGEAMTEARMGDLTRAMVELNPAAVAGGQLVGAHDDVLIVFAAVFRVAIDCDFVGTRIRFRTRAAESPPLRFRATRGHFSRVVP